MNRALYGALLALCVPLLGAAPAPAPAPAASAAPAPAPAPSGPPAYDTFVKGATVEPGLIPLVKKDGKVYFALQKSQLGLDFIETSIPSSGFGGSVGGAAPAAGEPYIAPARIIHFDRVDDTLVIRWPNTDALVDQQSPRGVSVRESLPNSVIAVAPIVAQNDTTVVISANAFLGDVANLSAIFENSVQNPAHGYRLDGSRTFFTKTKAFEKNDLLRVSQTWAAGQPDVFDNAPDPRSIEVSMTYNIIEAPHDHYVPRISDPRVGYFSLQKADFTHDAETLAVDYITRWNFAPEHPGTPSNATHPLVYTLSNDIPAEYRGTIRDALLQWNKAFERVGILNAVKVEQAPDDANFDSDDIRYNMIRWITTTEPQYGAEGLLVNDPRTAEEINVGVNVDAVEGRNNRFFRYVVAPARGLPDSAAAERAFEQQALYGVVLHESGHDLGLQHNFIGSTAYTAQQLQSKAFTEKYGVASSVMEYSPVNLWPKGTPQGDYYQTVLGPYDYYAIRYGYANSGAQTPDGEKAALQRWASGWNDPRTRFAGDEDSAHTAGIGIDPRVATFDLTDKPVQWCGVQMKMARDLMNAVNARFPQAGESYAQARTAFSFGLRQYETCALITSYPIGGEYLSRAHKNDPHSVAPLTAVSRRDEIAAWQQLVNTVFADSAWHFNPDVLTRLTYSEYAPFNGGAWGYTPSAHHDIAIVETVNAYQGAVLSSLFNPIRLQRIDAFATKYPNGATMTLTDLFDWTRAGIFGDIETNAVAKAGVIRQNLQVAFARHLARLATQPPLGTPPHAQALARLQLEYLANESATASHRSGLDELTRAHLEQLAHIARQALDAQIMAPV